MQQELQDSQGLRFVYFVIPEKVIFVVYKI